MTVVFWDFDGTLVHSTPLWSSSVYRALQKVDCNTKIEFADIRKCMASGFTWHTPDCDYSKMTSSKWWDFMIDKIRQDYIRLGVSDEIAKEAAQKVPDIIKKSENYILYADTVEALKRSISSGNTNVILSNNFPELMDIVNELGLSEYFDDIIVSAVIGYDKPRKEIFEHAKAKYPNEKYIMIGDSVSADIIGGNNSGMITVLVHNGYNTEADFCMDNLSDINFFEMGV